MSVEAPHSNPTKEAPQLTADQQAWIDYQNNLRKGRTAEDEDFFNAVFTEDVVPLSEAETSQPATAEEKEKGPGRLSRIKASLGALAGKITDTFTPRKPEVSQSPEDFKVFSGTLSEETASKKIETEKQPRFKLVDIKARAVEIVDRTKYNMGLAKEIGVEVKDILVEKAKDKFDAAKEKTLDAKDIAKDKFDTAKDKARDIKDAATDKALDAKHTMIDKAGRAKEIGIGLAGYVVTEGYEFLGSLIAKSAEFAKEAPNRLSERFTEAAPTPSNPNNRELNRRGKILVVGLGVTAFAGLTYLGRMAGVHHEDHGIDLANQVPLDNPGIDTVLSDMPDQLPMAPDTTTLSPDNLPGDQLPLQPDVIPTPDSVPDVMDTANTGVEPTHGDLKADFSPEIGTLEAGNNIWDDSMQMLKEGGFDGSEQELIDRTNLLTEWRLKEMGITPEQAQHLPVGTKLPMPEFADMQEIIAKAEQLKR